MSNEKAIRILKELWRFEKTDKFSEEEVKQALTIAISAIKFRQKAVDLASEVYNKDEVTQEEVYFFYAIDRLIKECPKEGD